MRSDQRKRRPQQGKNKKPASVKICRSQQIRASIKLDLEIDVCVTEQKSLQELVDELSPEDIYEAWLNTPKGKMVQLFQKALKNRKVAVSEVQLATVQAPLL